MRFNWFLIVLTSMLAAATFAASPPVGLGTVGGKVVDTKNQPVLDARVTLQASGGHFLQTTQTNAKGHFWFASLPEGQYSVRASDHDRVSEWRQNIWVSPGKQTDITLHLRPIQ
jgi:protocatechuate 3,4-dioxygenase beta subunit